MKKMTIIIFTFLIMFTLVGCGNTIYPNLPNDARGFATGSFIDINDDDAGYLTIEYNGRTYMPYGTLGKRIKASDIKECIGYIVQTEENSSIADPNDKDTRVYLLTEDKEENFIMVYYTGTTLMNQPDFFRAMDTNGEEIKTPDYILSLEYAYWK